MSLDCEACDALLIDLVERELDETRSAEVRAHAESCESCGRSLARLETGRRAARELVRAEPPRLDAVMAAARARAAEIRAAAVAEQARTESVPTPEAPTTPTQKEESWIDTALRWLGTWATRPQVAMAALLVLMVGIGVFNLPQFRSREGGDSDGALVEPDVRAEAAPSALDPADPLDLAVDPRTQRVALGGADHAEETTDLAHDERPTTTIATLEEPSAERQGATTTHEAEHEAPAELDSLAQELAVADIAPSDGVGRVEDGPLPEVATSAAEQAAVVLAPTPPTAPAPSAPHVATTPRPTAPSYDEVEPPSTSVTGVLPAAIHRQAQALASAGHCDQAVPRYRSLLAAHPDYAEAPRAMIELAECDRRLGRLDDAERWLARAESFPSVSADARRLRTRVAAEQRAVDRAGASSSSGSSETRGAVAPPPDTAASAY